MNKHKCFAVGCSRMMDSSYKYCSIECSMYHAQQLKILQSDTYNTTFNDSIYINPYSNGSSTSEYTIPKLTFESLDNVDLHYETKQQDITRKAIQHIQYKQDLLFEDILTLCDIEIIKPHNIEYYKSMINIRVEIDNYGSSVIHYGMGLAIPKYLVYVDDVLFVSFDLYGTISNIKWSDHAIEKANRKILQGQQNNYNIFKL